MEDKNEIVRLLTEALRATRSGVHLLTYMKVGSMETVIIEYSNGYRKLVDVSADSGCAMIRDVMKCIGV